MLCKCHFSNVREAEVYVILINHMSSSSAMLLKHTHYSASELIVLIPILYLQ